MKLQAGWKLAPCVLAIIIAGCMTASQIKEMAIRDISGKVTDDQNRPLSGAIVTTEPSTSSVSTDELGNYRIGGLPGGTYTIRATLMGYVGYPVRIEVRGFEPTRADLKLIPESLAPALPAYTAPEAPKSTNESSVTPSDNKTASEEKEGKKWWEKN